MMTGLKKLSAVFYEGESGREPVRTWLKGLNEVDRKIIGIDIATAEFGWPVGMPVCRKLEADLYEIRSSLHGGRISRVIFTIRSNRMILLHGFIKKSQKTPKSELETARKRKAGLL